MTIFLFIVGLILGWFLKFGFDKYHDFKTIEETRASRMEDLLVKFKAIELNKKV